ncbi:MAG: hypothetical protein K2X69_04330 [Silvanigrellaceae bacterium]|nr:hypothetical protein [Silvanigrellaceae bacterium]
MNTNLEKSSQKRKMIFEIINKLNTESEKIIRSIFHISLEIFEVLLYISIGVIALCIFYITVNHHNNPNFLPNLDLVPLLNSTPKILLCFFISLVLTKFLRKHF